jgi:hypothetical protein
VVAGKGMAGGNSASNATGDNNGGSLQLLSGCFDGTEWHCVLLCLAEQSNQW